MNGVPIALAVAAGLGAASFMRSRGSRTPSDLWWWLESWNEMEVYDASGHLVARTGRKDVPSERVFSYSSSLSDNHARYVYAKKWIGKNARTNGYLLMLGVASGWGRDTGRKLYQFGRPDADLSTLLAVRSRDYTVSPTLDGSKRLTVPTPKSKGSTTRWPMGTGADGKTRQYMDVVPDKPSYSGPLTLSDGRLVQGWAWWYGDPRTSHGMTIAFYQEPATRKHEAGFYVQSWMKNEMTDDETDAAWMFDEVFVTRSDVHRSLRFNPSVAAAVGEFMLHDGSYELTFETMPPTDMLPEGWIEKHYGLVPWTRGIDLAGRQGIFRSGGTRRPKDGRKAKSTIPKGWLGPKGSGARARSTLMQRMIPGWFRVVLFDEAGHQVPTRQATHRFRLFSADHQAAQENIALGAAVRAWRDAALPLAEGTVALLPEGPGLRDGFAHAFMYFLKARSTLNGVEFRYLHGRPRFMPTLDGTERLIDPMTRHGWEHATTRRFRVEGDKVIAIERKNPRAPRTIRGPT
jgi:hypothetical protein